MELLNISQAVKNYNHLHEEKPKFGMDVFSKDFNTKDIVILQNNGVKKNGTPVRFDFYIMILCLKGGSIRSVNQHDYPITQYSLQLLPPSTIHSFQDTHEKTEFYVLLFENNFIDKLEILDFHNKNFDNVDLDSSMFIKIKELYEEIDEELKNKKENTLDYVKNLLIQLLIILKREKLKIVKTENISKGDFISSQFLCLIEENFFEKKNVSDYANIIGITSKHLGETIKEKLGKNALYFIHRRIIKEAKYLLIYSNKNIYEIAISLNFNDAAQFTRFFKQKVGIPPKKYRMDLKNP